MTEIYKQENLNQDNFEIPDGETERLQAELKKLIAIQEAEASKFVKSGKKSKPKEMARMALSEVRELRTVEVVSDGEGKFHFIWRDKDNYPKKLTRGDILSGMEWGIYYDLNHLDLPGRNLREGYDDFRKKYVNHFYQRKIDRLTNMELAVNFSQSEQDSQIANAYKETYFRLKDEKEGEGGPAGIMLETMLKCLLLKVAEDFGHRHDFNYFLERGNVFADVNYKSDIIIKFTQNKRGVNVNESSKVKGFQVTLIPRNHPKLLQKLKQIEKANERLKGEKASGKNTIVDEVVDFKVEVGEIRVTDAFKNWVKNGRSSFGPELFLGATLIMECLTDIFQKSDLDLNLNKQMRDILESYFKDKM